MVINNFGSNITKNYVWKFPNFLVINSIPEAAIYIFLIIGVLAKILRGNRSTEYDESGVGCTKEMCWIKGE